MDWERLAHLYDCFRVAGLNIEAIHQPSCPDDAYSHAGLRLVTSVKDFLEVPDARAGVTDRDFKCLGLLQQDMEMNFPVARVPEGIPRHLRGGSGKSNLLLIVKAKQCGDFAGALPGLYNIAFCLQANSMENFAHKSTWSLLQQLRWCHLFDGENHGTILRQ